MSIDTKSQEAISLSYFLAVAATKNIVTNSKKRDDFSIDLDISKHVTLNTGVVFTAQINVQLKSTNSSHEYSINEDCITYYLKAKNYNDLVASTAVPIILALLILPEEESSWVCQDVDKLILRKCMYWVSLKGLPATDNSSSVAVKIPLSQVVTGDNLENLLIKEGNGLL